MIWITEEKQEFCTLIEDLLSLISMLCFSVVADRIRASFQKQILSKKADCPYRYTMHTHPEEYCSDRVCAGNSIKN